MKRLISLWIIMFCLSPTVADAKRPGEVNCYSGGAYWDSEAGYCMPVTQNDNVSENVSKISENFNAFAYAVVYVSSGLALIMIVQAGFQYTMSEGDPFKIEEAKKMIIRAGIGMLIAFSAYHILNLIDTFQTL